MIGERTFREGDVITVDGETGFLYAGVVPAVSDGPPAALAEIEPWIHQAA
jgi:hypothetical protein